MRKIFLLLLIGFLHNSVFSQGIYNYNITTVQDSVIHLSDLQGKQLLIVNTSLSGSRISQYRQLDTLYRQYKNDGLVVIAVPTKDFDNTITGNEQLLALYNELHLSYIMTKLMTVKDNGQAPLYNWLTHEVNNGVMDAPVTGDFFKLLIDPSGAFKGVFSGRVTPLEPLLVNGIKN